MNTTRIALVLALTTAGVIAQQPYRLPPAKILDAATAPPPPSVSVAPTKDTLLLTHRESMPSIAVLARPVLRLAGQRIDPATHGRQRTGGRSTGFTVVSVADGSERKIEIAGDADVGSPVWTSGGERFAFTNTVGDRIELWIADVATAKARKVPGVVLSGTGFAPVQWMPDQKTLLCSLWPGGQAPVAPRVPTGPNIQQSDGSKAPVRTYQDLLQSAHDADLFEFHASSQLALVDPATGSIEKIGEPGIFRSVAPSPDSRLLLVDRIHRPFSFLVTAFSFPHEIAVWDLEGNRVRQIADHPLADKVPIGGVQTGPRSAAWIPTEPASLAWVEALDGGDPKAEVPHRDRVLTQSAPFSGVADEWFRTEYRFGGGWRGGGLTFDETGEVAFATTSDRERRWTRTWKLSPKDRSVAPVLWHERAQRDSYADIGSPVTVVNPAGFRVIARQGNAIFLRGQGATPQGDRPFFDLVDLTSKESRRLFRCRDGMYEQALAVLDNGELLVQRESPTEPPNYFVVAGEGDGRPVTRFVDAQAELTEGIQKKLLVYERADGVPLSATLYTPPGYQKGQKLPLVVWAYPREFVSIATAGQVRGSQHRYTRLSGMSQLMLLLDGYAVLDNAAMPIIGPKETANDTFVEQLVASARAAIDVAVAEGVADRQRVAIGGHSYGAFMTANLLAHSDLFRTGIARSGAYNRTLTPFGFQNERRTFWEAPEIYFAMSPFMHAQEIDEPILMIHGEADNNSGTFPIQSRRLYHAIKGNGGVARLVMLPHESHGYRARESVLHVLAESSAWLDRYVKNADLVEAATIKKK